MDKSRITRRRVFNMYLYYFVEKGLHVFANLKKSQLKRDPNYTYKHLIPELTEELKSKEIPPHWFESVIRYIVKDEFFFPDHEYLALKVSNQYIFSSNLDTTKLEDLKGKVLQIEISGKVSPRQIRRFLEENNEFIKKVEAVIELPEAKQFSGDKYKDSLHADWMRHDIDPPTFRELHEFFNSEIEDEEFQTVKKRVKRAKEKRAK